MHHRNDTERAAGASPARASWSTRSRSPHRGRRSPRVFDDVRAAMLAVPHARAATCHLSHSYLDGACLYFTFAATPPADEVEATYVALWDAGQPCRAGRRRQPVAPPRRRA